MTSRPSSTKKHAGLKGLSEWKPLYDEEKQPSTLSSTPYRLPKIDEMPANSVYSRHGFIFRCRPPTSAGFYTKRISPARQSKRFAGPSFRKVMIAPNQTPRLIAADHSDPLFKSLLRNKTFHGSKAHPEIDPTPTPRAITPYDRNQNSNPSNTSRSMPETSSVYWIVPSNRFNLVDKKGYQQNQGPFSREFTVHCMTPANWLKMKLGSPQRTGYRCAMMNFKNSNSKLKCL